MVEVVGEIREAGRIATKPNICGGWERGRWLLTLKTSRELGT